MEDNNKKPMTIDGLAVIVAKGFEHVENMIGGVETRMGQVEHQMKALNSNVNNYLELSEKRYAELKQDVIK
jgi:hypothetical protein